MAEERSGLPTERGLDLPALLVARLAARADDEAARVRNELLEQLHATGDWPAPTTPARPAKACELPANAAATVKGARDPWTVTALYALGAVPYSWNHRAGGYMLADSIAVRIAHPDGRRGVGTWIRNGIAVRKGEHVLAWKWYEGWHWRTGEHGTFPKPCGARLLKAAVADPTWRTNPYVIEEAAA